MSMESHEGMILTGEIEELGEKPVPVLLCPPQIPNGLKPGTNQSLHGKRLATNRLSHGMAVTWF
jgi:hypothetical protein